MKQAKQRLTIYIRDQDKNLLEEYLDIWYRCNVFPKKLSKEGHREYYRRVIMNRLQNMTYKSISNEHGISVERARQIFCRFKNWCTRRKEHSLDRVVLGQEIKL